MILPRVTLPWPPSLLSPNGSQGDYRGKSASAKAYKSTCAAIMREKGRSVQKLPDGAVVDRVILTCCPPPNVHRYDLDNMAKRMKQGLDAFAEAIGVDDGEWCELVVRRGKKCKLGGVVVNAEVQK